MTEILVPAPAPSFGEVIVSPTGAADDLPVPTAPYYRLYEQGMFLHRPLVFGHGIVRNPTYKAPKRLKAFEHPGGYFYFTGPRLPINIMAQAINFFRRALADKNSEAEVIVTQNYETKEHRLFIPTQWVGKGGVRSLYNPEHIAQGWLVIGTIHSHCDFSPRHSGIDEADAKKMDGIHLVIGMLQNELPEYDAMVSMNKMLWDYPPATLADLPTAAEIAEFTAPDWWDRYVLNHAPTDEERPAYATDEDWDGIMGRTKKWTTHTPQAAVTTTPSRWVPPAAPKPLTTQVDTRGWDDKDWEMAERYGWIWDEGQQNFVHISEFEGTRDEILAQRPRLSEDLLPGGPSVEDDDEDDREERLAYYEFYQDYWEDILGHEYVDGLYDTGLMSDEDLDAAMDAGDESLLPAFWEARMRKKLVRLVSWFREQGYEARITLNEPKRPLPGQTELFTEPLAPTSGKGAHI